MIDAFIYVLIIFYPMPKKIPAHKIKKKTYEAIDVIFGLFHKVRKIYPEIANAYSRHIRSVSTRTRTRLPSHLKRSICSNCHVILVPSVNCRIRLRGGKEGKNIVYYCFSCKKFTKFGYGKK